MSARTAGTISLNGADRRGGALRAPFRQRLRRLAESGTLGWSAVAFILALIALAPIIAIAAIALLPSGDAWPHLIANVLPRPLRRTLGLMDGVGALTLLIGTSTAWLVTMYRFPRAALFSTAASAPPRQSDLYHRLHLSRDARLFGHLADDVARYFRLARRQGLLVPRHQSLGGAIPVMSTVLYPYV
jgi:iron(III) transport system permease protein